MYAVFYHYVIGADRLEQEGAFGQNAPREKLPLSRAGAQLSGIALIIHPNVTGCILQFDDGHSKKMQGKAGQVFRSHMQAYCKRHDYRLISETSIAPMHLKQHY